jgi:hypothetical protein
MEDVLAKDELYYAETILQKKAKPFYRSYFNIAIRESLHIGFLL